MELTVRMPRIWQHKELELRKEMSKLVERGTSVISLLIQYKNVEDKVVPINHDVAEYYIGELKKVADKTGVPISSLYQGVFDFPNITSPLEEENKDDDWKLIMEAVRLAYTDFNNFRITEGQMLKSELDKMCKNILGKLEELEPFENARVENVRTKLQKEMQQMESNGMVDKNRFEQELIYYLEKLDISEEKVRLKQHCEYFMTTGNDLSSGKKLAFISQEIGREINTIGSKANEANLQRKVVEMKDELEKIKEQLNNIL